MAARRKAKTAVEPTARPAAKTNGADLSDIEQFLYSEAACLDDRDRWEEWLGLFTDDAMYWMPYSKDQPDPVNHASMVYEDKLLRAVRVAKLKHPRAWSQQPPSRTARIVGNVMIGGRDAKTGDVIVHSTFNMLEFRRDRATAYGGTYTHHLRRGKDGWRIAMKRVDLITGDGIYEQIIQLPI